MHMKNREKHRIAQEEKKKNLLIAGAVVKEKKITNKQLHKVIWSLYYTEVMKRNKVLHLQNDPET